jgi:hypothetical protein
MKNNTKKNSRDHMETKYVLHERIPIKYAQYTSELPAQTINKTSKTKHTQKIISNTQSVH